jgi:hypothetical protein
VPVLDHISFQVDLGQLFKMIHVREGSANATEVTRMVAEAEAVARPKALYIPAYIDERGDDYVIADGLKFTSRVLAVNTQNTHRIFPYVCTSGVELEAWANDQDDVLARYWADMINQIGVGIAGATLYTHLQECYGMAQLSSMNPGSLGSWPLSEQRVLFALLGDVQGAIGVELTPSLLMTPTKSASGIQFPTEGTFASCQLCPRQNCPNRRAEYDATLYASKYQ